MLKFKYRIYIILFLFIPVFSTGASANNKSVDVSSVIQVEDNLLTVKVRDIPLRKVLMEIANQTPIKIVLYASAEEPFITNFSRLPIEKGLKKLLRDYNYIFTYGAEKLKDGGYEIRKVIVLSNEGKSLHRRMEPTIAYSEEPPLYDDPYNEDVDIPEENMPDPLEELETMMASTGGPSLEPLSIEQYEEDMDIREDIESEIIIDPLRDELQDEDIEVRLSAVMVLGVIGGDKAIQVLEEALEDEDEKVREMAAEELKRLKGEE